MTEVNPVFLSYDLHVHICLITAGQITYADTSLQIARDRPNSLGFFSLGIAT